MSELKEMPRGLSRKSIQELMLEDRCPMCLGELDTGWECNDCGYDCMYLANMFDLDALRRRGSEKAE